MNTKNYAKYYEEHFLESLEENFNIKFYWYQKLYLKLFYFLYNIKEKIFGVEYDRR